MLCKLDVLKNFCKFHNETHVLESPFNKIASLKACNFIKNRLYHRWSPVLQNTVGGSFSLQHLPDGHSHYYFKSTVLVEYKKVLILYLIQRNMWFNKSDCILFIFIVLVCGFKVGSHCVLGSAKNIALSNTYRK